MRARFVVSTLFLFLLVGILPSSPVVAVVANHVRIVAFFSNGSAMFTQFVAQHSEGRGYVAEIHDTCYRIMRLNVTYYKDLHWQREFLTNECQVWSYTEESDMTQADFCAEYEHECLDVTITALRKSSPPSPYAARLLAAHPETAHTYYSFMNIQSDVCHHPNYFIDNATLLLSKVIPRTEYLIPKDDVYSEFTLQEHAHMSTPLHHHNPHQHRSHESSAFEPPPHPSHSPPPADTTLRVLCVLMTYAPNHVLALAAVELWGSKCSGVVVFSNATDWSIPVVTLWRTDSSSASSAPPVFEERYDMMWKKFRSAYLQTYQSYKNDFDYFFFGDDDTYAVVANLFYCLHTNVHANARRTAGTGVYAGRPIWNFEYEIYYATGGGFVVDSVALSLLAEKLQNNRTGGGHMADVYVAVALRDQGVHIIDTRDKFKQHTFHQYSPAEVFSYTGNGVTEVDMFIGNYYKLLTYEFIPGVAGCSKDSIVFHKLNRHLEMRVVDAILTVCQPLLQ